MFDGFLKTCVLIALCGSVQGLFATSYKQRCRFILEGISVAKESNFSKVLSNEIQSDNSGAKWSGLKEAISAVEHGKGEHLELVDDGLSSNISVKAKKDELRITIGETKLKNLSVGENPKQPTAALKPLIKTLIFGLQERVKRVGRPVEVTLRATNVQNVSLAKSLKERGFKPSVSLMKRLFGVGTIAMAGTAIYHGFPVHDVVATGILGWFAFKHTGQDYTLKFQMRPDPD